MRTIDEKRRAMMMIMTAVAKGTARVLVREGKGREGKGKNQGVSWTRTVGWMVMDWICWYAAAVDLMQQLASRRTRQRGPAETEREGFLPLLGIIRRLM